MTAGAARVGAARATAAPALRSTSELTPEWCTVALADVLAGRGRVETCEATPIGTGQVADTVRLTPTYRPRGVGPGSLVVKLTAAAAASRATARVTRSYEIETGFYCEVATTVAVRRPHCHHAVFDPATDAYTLVLEDVSPARAGDQLAGCRPNEVALAVEQLARLHGPRWGDPALDRLAWLPRHDGPAADHMASLVVRIAPRFLRRYGDRLSPDVVGLVERFVPQVARYLRQRPDARTVVHGDYRTDNLLFGPDGTVTVVDWQTAAHEPGPTDLAYLLGASLPPADRRGVERELVRTYARGLHHFGVRLGADDAWREYRRYALGGLLMALVASMLVPRSERADKLFLCMAGRHGRHALDLDAEALLAATT